MKKSYSFVIAFGIFFLFLIQMMGTLVESIYILDLMNSSLDEKALGVLFFFSPILLLPLRIKKTERWAWVTFGLLFLSRGLTPYLSTVGRMLASGIGTGAALILFAFLMKARPKEDVSNRSGLWVSAGLALAVVLSIFLRTLNYSLDYSLTPGGGWLGWGLGLLLGYLLTQVDWMGRPEPQKAKDGPIPAVLGIFMVLALVYFAFSAPAVIVRWTEGDYALIVIVISLLSVGWGILAFSRPGFFDRLPKWWLVLWNVLFALSLTGTILAHRVSFPATPESAAVVVGAPSAIQQIPLGLTMLLFPVIFLDMRVFFEQIQAAASTPRDLIPGMLLGSLTLVLLVFMYIFTNVWGYVKPVSPWFRNKFWLPYLLMAGIVSLLSLRKRPFATDTDWAPVGTFHWGWGVLLGALFLGTTVSAMLTTRVRTFETNKSSLLVMTYNIQQANDEAGERSYERQLAIIRQVSPDILSLQESDSTRISLNNNDYVRYYAGKLGYHSYYGPKTVTGTYGTALLSKYPLQNTRTVFSYSDKDEIGTTVAEIDVDGRQFTIYDVHPDGSDTAMLVFAQTLLERSKDKPYVIALGDYNLRDYEEAYKLIDSVYTNAWTSVYPSEISPDGVDMSGDNRIDHIFFSPSLSARNPVYVLPPDSATDHPVHWAEIFWK
jgi:endonuclease/exonuclease/phosphatase family metal-dependent hydrolase